jgi:xylulokinase
MDWYLAIDLGTQGPKVAAVADGGKILVDGFVPVETRRESDGAATQRPDDWWQALRDLVRKVGASVDNRPRAVGITGQYGSTVPVDEEGRAVASCLMWADARGSEELSGLLRSRRPDAVLRLRLWERLAGGAPDLGGDPLTHEHLLRSRYPDVWARTKTVLEPIDYLAARLTGRVAATPASMIASFLVRPSDNSDAPRYSPTLLRLARRDGTRLPQLARTGAVLGPITRQAAAELGLATDTPVVAPISDLHSAYLGSGALSEGEAHLVLSSTSWLGLATRTERSDGLRGINTVPGVGPGHLLVENSQSTAGIALDWVIRTLFSKDDGPREDQHRRLVDAALRAPSGAGGVRFAPWLDGERAPLGAPELKGALVGLTTTTTPEDVARATLEGLAANARLLVQGVSRVMRTPIHELRLMGRCAELDGLCQIVADVTQLPCHRVAEPRLACLRGAAILAACARGRLELRQADAWSPTESTFEPASPQHEFDGVVQEHCRAIAFALNRHRRTHT